MAEEKGETVDKSRRRFLLASTSVVGGAGVVAWALPFIFSMEPSAAAQAAGAPVEADISKLEKGQMMTVSWRSRPVWILNRSDAQLKVLPTMTPQLKDPNSDAPQQLPQYKNMYRSIKPEYLVVVGICTHLGCVPGYRPEIAPPDLGPSWKGGFLCPCHGSRYDLSARVINGSPAPLNMPIPPHFYVSDTVVRIGELKNGTEQNWNPAIW